jgi:N-acyl-D-aspartate/D-glutamate deacylase
VDVVIRGASVVDGTGAAAFLGDVAVRDGLIAYVGPSFAGSAEEQIDATGLTLTPGFIDIHTHFDPQLCWDGRADPSLCHGVTTVVVGNCGLSVAPIRDQAAADHMIGMFGRIEDIKRRTFEAGVPYARWFGGHGSFGAYLDHIRPGLSINVGALVGHSAIRLCVMGDAAQEREATQAEVDAMVALVDDAMAAGAIGVSSNYADNDEHGVPRVISDCHFSVQLDRFIPGFLSYSVAVFLK